MATTGLYEANLRVHLKTILQRAPGKHSLLTHAKYAATLDTTELENLCQSVINVNEKADFVLIKLIRLLFFPVDELAEAQTRVEQALVSFPFWIHKDKDAGQYGPIEKITFWSENHTFMFLSSAHLFYQRAKKKGLACLAGEHEEKLLRAYLDAHVAFGGVYEVLSCTYLPYTINSLLNLFDFSDDETIREKAHLLLDKIISQLLLVCNEGGVCNLSASARQFPAFRFRNTDHNVNQLIQLCTGVSPDPIKSSSVADFLLTSSYRAADELIERSWKFTGFCSQRVNHETSATRALYEGTGIEPLECTPFYWSAGLITHPRFVGSTKEFQKQYNLHELPGIKYLDFVPNALAESTMKSYSSLACGQNYTDIVLNVYKSRNRKVVLSSFENFNVNLRSFQQNPWMANLSGVPLWTQSGSLGKKMIPCFNDFGPSVTQKGNLLLAVYATPLHRDGVVSSLFASNISFMTWPRHYFEAEVRMLPSGVCGPAPDDLPGQRVTAAGLSSDSSAKVPLDTTTRSLLQCDVVTGVEKNSWWCGLRDSCYVGVYCSHETTETTEVYSSDKTFPMMRMFSTDPENILPRRVCSKHNHAWVVVVGDSLTYPTFFDFLSHIKSVKVHVERGNGGVSGSSYSATVTDANWKLSARVEK